MTHPPFNVLFLCTGNSARSIMPEAILNSLGRDRVRAFSAGSQPKGEVHPMALAQLQRANLPTEGYRSKSWSEFSTGEAPRMDFVFTVCDNAANEACPTWPGQPMTAHWGIPDPAAVEGTDADKQSAFARAFMQLQTRISLFLALPMTSLDRMSLQQNLREIGRASD
jgi:arsenate reductase